jgi:putative ABC transport system permease protein
MKFFRKLSSLFRRRSVEAEMAAEMEGHIDELTERNIAAGMAPDEARFAARREFGGVEQIKERARDVRGWQWLEDVGRDFRQATRHLAKNRAFTIVAVLTIAVAIGVNSATFSIVRDLLLRPVVRDASQHLVSLYTRRNRTAATARDYRRFSYREFDLLRKGDVFRDVAAVLIGSGAVGSGEQGHRRLFYLVSENYFSLLGVRPYQGRFFTAEETQPNSGRSVVVANYAYWQGLGRPADLVGHSLRIDGRNYTVIGIAPPGFGGLHSAIAPAVWLPLGAAALIPSGLWGDGPQDLQNPQSYRLDLVGALPPGHTLAIARTQLGSLESELTALAGGGAADARRLLITPPPRLSLGSEQPVDESFLPRFATIALGMAGCVLLVACLNLANLLLARGVARRREFAIRLSLGASRWRVVRQLWTEGLLLALTGGAVGVLLSWWIGDALQEFNSQLFSADRFTFNRHAPIDASSIATMFGLCFVATLAFSLLPAWRATKLDLVADLKSASAGAGSWARFFSLGHSLVMLQIAFALMLLFCAALFLRAAWTANHADYGFRTAGELVANVDYSLGRTPVADIPQRQQALLARASTVTGVTHAALASAVPYNFETNLRRVFAAGEPSGEAGRSAAWSVVSHDYFQTVGITLLRGREFTPEEGNSNRGPRVAIVDDGLARALFGLENPIGQRVSFQAISAAGESSDRSIEIVGVIRSPRDEVFDAAAPMRIYQPLGQVPVANIYLHVSVTPPEAATGMISRLRADANALDAENAALSVRPLGDYIAQNINLSLVHLAAAAFGTFGFVSLLLATVGVYAVKAHAVARRTREIGIRMALGAQRSDVLVLIVKQGVWQTAVGIAVGAVLSLIAGVALSKMLYQVSPTDPLAVGAATAVIAAAAFIACVVPARRAATVSPMTALRAE